MLGEKRLCLTCSIIKGEVFPAGGIIYKNDFVILHHCIDINIAGYLIISPVRHVEDYCELNQFEMQQIGVISQLAAAILKQVKGVDKIYLATFGEETAHFHMHIFPRYSWMLYNPKADICTSNKIDGAKLLSFCREKYKVRQEEMSSPKF